MHLTHPIHPKRLTNSLTHHECIHRSFYMSNSFPAAGSITVRGGRFSTYTQRSKIGDPLFSFHPARSTEWRELINHHVQFSFLWLHPQNIRMTNRLLNKQFLPNQISVSNLKIAQILLHIRIDTLGKQGSVNIDLVNKNLTRHNLVFHVKSKLPVSQL